MGKIPACKSGHLLQYCYIILLHHKLSFMKIIFYVLITVLTFITFTSCNAPTSQSPISHVDSLKIKNWDLLTGNKISDSGGMKVASFAINRPVHHLYGKACVDEYAKAFSTSSVETIDNFRKNRFTDYVVFKNSGLDGVGSGKNLYQWMANYKLNHQDCEGFAVCFGLYVDPDLNTYPDLDPQISQFLKRKMGPNNKDHIGRMTVFIRPYPFPVYINNAQTTNEDDYFNLGEINPPPGQ
jgi:hypothetical protein